MREYTLLLDPPTFAPPPTTSAAEAVTAPIRSAPADSGQIQRPAPQPAQQPAQQPPPSPVVQAPVQADAVEAQPEPEPQPEPVFNDAASEPEPVAEPAVASQAPASAPQQADNLSQPAFDTVRPGDVLVQRGDTLWGITQRVRPDSRLTINQTMLAIYEANPQAFEGNINRLRAGATLNIPSADDIYRISRGDAFAEVRRQNAEWRGDAPVEPESFAVDPEPVAEPEPEPIADPVESQPSLTLVPPDEEDLAATDTGVDTVTTVDDPVDDVFVDPVDARIQEIEAILDDPSALVSIPDNELAALRQELANLRGDELPLDEPPADDLAADDAASDDAAADAVDDAAGDTAAESPAVVTTPAVVTQPARDDGIVGTIMGYLDNFWVWIGAALLVTVGILFWFMRRAANRDDEDMTGVWTTLDEDDADDATMAEMGMAPEIADHGESIVVEEAEPSVASDAAALADTMDSPIDELSSAPGGEGTMEMPAPETMEIPAMDDGQAEADPLSATGTSAAIDDTFSSETAVNLDQSDPIAEADFHMAYGLYDQAADLINGALAADADRPDLLAKLSEIYFVWGNRDGFVDAAMRFKNAAGDANDGEWDKIVIMGQQIAADHELFTGASAEGVTKAVDLSFDDASDAGELDIDFAGTPEADSEDVIDLAAPAEEEVVTDETGQVLISPDSGSGIDFSFDDDAPSLEASATREMPVSDNASDDEDAGQSPTIEQQLAMDATGEMPALDQVDDVAAEPVAADATAEIDLDDLGLDLESLDESDLAADVEQDVIDELADTASGEALDIDDLAETGRNPQVEAAEVEDADEITGKNETLVGDDLEATNTREVLEMKDDPTASGVLEASDVEDALAATGELPSLDTEGTGISRALNDDDATQLASLDDDDDDPAADTDVDLDASLLDATGQTQILTEDMAVEATGVHQAVGDSDADEAALPDPGFDDEKTQQLPEDAATMLAPLDADEDDEFDFAKTEALPEDAFSTDMAVDETGRMPALAGSTDMDLDLDDLTAALRVSEVGDTVNQLRDDATVEQPRINTGNGDDTAATSVTQALAPDEMSADLSDAKTMTEVGTKLDLARAYVDMGDPAGARSILDEVLDEGDEAQRQQAQQLIDSLPG